MLVRDWMSPHPVTVSPYTSVLNARRLLRTYEIRHLPVVDGDQLVGICSDRDLSVGDREVAQSLSTLQSDLLHGRYRQVASVMTSPVQVVRPDESIAVAAQLMMRWRLSSVPVISDGELIGILTTTDCLRALLSRLDDDHRRGGGQEEAARPTGAADAARVVVLGEAETSETVVETRP